MTRRPRPPSQVHIDPQIIEDSRLILELPVSLLFGF